MDVSVPQIGANLMWGGTPPNFPTSGYSGRGCKLGIIGSGIDFKHEDFIELINNVKRTRIQYIWDQTVAAGALPSGPTPKDYGILNPGAGSSSMTYGAMWGPGQIETAIAGGQQISHVDTEGWGTGCASIAGGNGRAAGGIGYPANKFVGVAPKAKFLIVKLANQSTSLGGNDIGRVIDAVKWMWERCMATGTFNLSILVPTIDFGGPCDSTGKLEKYISQYVPLGHIDELDDNGQPIDGAWRQLWITTSAGNYGGTSRKAEQTTINPLDTKDFIVTIPNYTPQTITPATGEDGVMIELAMDDTTEYAISVIDPSAVTQLTNIARGTKQIVSTSSGYVECANYGHNFPTGGGDVKAYVYLSRKTTAGAKIAAGDWKIRVKQIGTDGARVDARITKYSASVRGAGGEKPVFKAGGGLIEARMITSPADASGCLAAAAYSTKTSWVDATGVTRNSGATAGSIMPWSSPGYLRTIPSGPNVGGYYDIQRPDVAAPATAVASRSVNDTDPANASYFLQNTTVHRMYVGALVAAAHLCGAIALWQEWYNVNFYEPYNIMSDVREAFRDRTAFDTATGSVPNVTWGYGKLNCAFNTAPPGGISGDLFGSDGGSSGDLPDDIPPIVRPVP